MKERLEKYGRVLENEPLKFHTTYKIGGRADFYIEPDTGEHFSELLDELNQSQTPFLVLGKGSNVLVSDDDYHGVVISLSAFRDFHFEEDGTLVAQAGCSLIHLAQEALKHSLSGLEFASGIPGSVGGGLYMNAGAYRSDMAAILKEVQIYKDGKIIWMNREDLDYTYRHSLFQSHKDWIILAGRFGLIRRDAAEIRRLMESRKQRRLSSQPVDKPCAGSVFRNPPGMNAWKIVDDLGFRGKRIGGAKVSEIHSNFIVNDRNARAADVDALIRIIQKEAREKFGVDLITEVERINWHA